MAYTIHSIGLDVHARSIMAVAFNPITGEVISKEFGYNAGSSGGMDFKV